MGEEENILRQIDEYEVEVEGKVSKAAFPYPPILQEYEMVPIARDYEYALNYDKMLQAQEEQRLRDMIRMTEIHLVNKLEQQLFIGPIHS